MGAAAQVCSASPKPLFPRSARPVLAWMPLLFPINQFRGFHQLPTVEFRAHSEKRDVLEDQIHWVHLQLGRQVFQRAHRQETALRMIGSPPRPSAADVGGDGRVNLSLVREVPDVGQRGAPRLAATPPVPHDSDCQASSVPSLLAPILTRAKAEGRAPATSNSALRSSISFTGFPVFWGEPGTRNAPAVNGGGLASESSANVLHQPVDVGCGQTQRLGKLSRPPRHPLRGGVYSDAVAFPVHHLSVRFQTAMGDYRQAVLAFHHYLRFLERPVGSPLVCSVGGWTRSPALLRSSSRTR